MSQKPEDKREYNFSDAHLKQLADEKYNNIQRDVAQFMTRGVTNIRIANFQGMINTFASTTDDKEAEGTVTIMIQSRDTAAENVRVHIRTIRTAAGNVFSTEDAYYKIYGFEGMDKLADEDLFRMAKRVSRVTQSQLQQLAPEGITNATVTSLNALVNVFDNAIDIVEDARCQRDIQKQDRIRKGNILYREMGRLCDIGKDIFASIDEARFNDYTIYNTTSGGSDDAPDDAPPQG